MNTNVGGIDKVIRIVVGLALLALLVWGDGNVRWFGVIGLIPLGTALMGWCPLYTLFGISSCPLGSKEKHG